MDSQNSSSQNASNTNSVQSTTKSTTTEYEDSHDTQYTLAPLLEPFNEQISRKDLREDDRAFLLYNFLSTAECKYYIDEATKLGLVDLTYQKRYRNNERVVVKSEEISALYWERIKPFIKPIILEPRNYKQTGQGFHLDGLWEPIGLNPSWRICKYNPGGHFGPHHDGAYIINNNYRSLKTLNIYLNGDFEGGTTNFVNEAQDRFVDSEGRIVAEGKNILNKIVPETGLALVFNHYLLHEGEPLKTNVKYIMRSDIMFIRRNPPEIPPKEAEAIRLYDEASKLEIEGKLREAGKLYAQAARLWPEIEFSQKI